MTAFGVLRVGTKCQTLIAAIVLLNTYEQGMTL
jgi:hypothetical protein